MAVHCMDCKNAILGKGIEHCACDMWLLEEGFTDEQLAHQLSCDMICSEYRLDPEEDICTCSWPDEAKKIQNGEVCIICDKIIKWFLHD